MNSLLRRRTIALVVMTCIITITITVWAGGPGNTSQVFAAPPTVPDACLNDQGNPVIPRVPVQGARALVLNFDHPLDWFETAACLATLDPYVDPEEYEGVIVDGVGYEEVSCTIVGNTGPIGIGNGSARFSDGSHISCPSELLATGVQMHKFYVFAKATFHNTGPEYFTLADHPDFEVKANVNANWHVKLKSRYGDGAPFFSHRNIQANVQNTIVPLFSRILGATGSGTAKGKHKINGRRMLPHANVGPFSITDEAPIIIGKSEAGYAWNVDIIIIDPPNGYH